MGVVYECRSKCLPSTLWFRCDDGVHQHRLTGVPSCRLSLCVPLQNMLILSTHGCTQFYLVRALHHRRGTAPEP